MRKLIFPICNKRPERAPKIFGHTFFLCWRCTGIVVGAICTFALIKGLSVTLAAPIFVLALACMLPMACDGIMQYGYGFESNNVRRFLSGLLFGAGVVCAIGYIINDFARKDHNCVVLYSVISAIGFLVTFFCFRLELRRVLKEKSGIERRKLYEECYGVISEWKRDPGLIMDPSFTNSILDYGSKLCVSASSDVINKFAEIEAIATESCEKHSLPAENIVCEKAQSLLNAMRIDLGELPIERK